MKFNLKKNLLTNVSLKVIALIIGYGVWHILSESHAYTVSIQVPLCFYNVSPSHDIDAPESVTLELQAKKKILTHLNRTTMAVHIDAAQLHYGHNPLIVNNTTLFLPDTVNVVHYSPTNVVIIVKEKISA